MAALFAVFAWGVEINRSSAGWFPEAQGAFAE